MPSYDGIFFFFFLCKRCMSPMDTMVTRMSSQYDNINSVSWRVKWVCHHMIAKLASYDDKINPNYLCITTDIRIPKLTRFKPAQYWGGGPGPCHCMVAILLLYDSNHAIDWYQPLITIMPSYDDKINPDCLCITTDIRIPKLTRFEPAQYWCGGPGPCHCMVAILLLYDSNHAIDWYQPLITIMPSYDDKINPDCLCITTDIRIPRLTRFEPAQYWGGGPGTCQDKSW
jgi:hypothetical protein